MATSSAASVHFAAGCTGRTLRDNAAQCQEDNILAEPAPVRGCAHNVFRLPKALALLQPEGRVPSNLLLVSDKVSSSGKRPFAAHREGSSPPSSVSVMVSVCSVVMSDNAPRSTPSGFTGSLPPSICLHKVGKAGEAQRTWQHQASPQHTHTTTECRISVVAQNSHACNICQHICRKY